MVYTLSLHAIDQLRNLCHHDSSYPHVVCSVCQSFNQNVNFCPYYDVSDKAYARLNATIETMNE